MDRQFQGMPLPNQRIMAIINENFGGNVSKFALAMGLSNSSKINRLFKKDRRNDEYPLPSTDILILIADTFNFSIDYILKGKMQNGSAIINPKNPVENENKYLDIIKKQQEQIDELLKILSNKEH